MAGEGRSGRGPSPVRYAILPMIFSEFFNLLRHKYLRGMPFIPAFRCSGGCRTGFCVLPRSSHTMDKGVFGCMLTPELIKHVRPTSKPRSLPVHVKRREATVPHPCYSTFD